MLIAHGGVSAAAQCNRTRMQCPHPLAAVRVQALGQQHAICHLSAPCRQGPAVHAGQRFAEQLLQQLEASGQRRSGGHGAEEQPRQQQAMLAAERRMRALGMETHWQPFNGAAAGALNSSSRGGGGGGAAEAGLHAALAAARQAGGCVNLHGVLRAPRGDGTEALALATPLALPSPGHTWPGGVCSGTAGLLRHCVGAVLCERALALCSWSLGGPPPLQADARQPLCRPCAAQAGGRRPAAPRWRSAPPRRSLSTWRPCGGWPKTWSGSCRTRAVGCCRAWRCTSNNLIELQTLPKSIPVGQSNHRQLLPSCLPPM